VVSVLALRQLQKRFVMKDRKTEKGKEARRGKKSFLREFCAKGRDS